MCGVILSLYNLKVSLEIDFMWLYFDSVGLIGGLMTCVSFRIIVLYIPLVLNVTALLTGSEETTTPILFLSKYVVCARPW